MNSNKKNFSAIVLAAGEGKRMKSPLPKVLHPIAGKPMFARTLEILENVQPDQIIMVVSPKNIEMIKKSISRSYTLAIQELPMGTADAARAGLAVVKPKINTVAIMYGDDTAFYKPETIYSVFKKHQNLKSKITFVTLEKDDPIGYGRIIRKNGQLSAIIEEKDLQPDQKKIKEINDGLYFFDKNWLVANLPKLRPSPISGELYITDLIKLALQEYEPVVTYKLKDVSQWHGINTPEELSHANQRLKTPIKEAQPLERIHIMGAAGAGASAVFKIAQSYNYKVTGCDLKPHSAYTSNLNIRIIKGHSPRHLKNIKLLVISEAILKFDPQNPEIKEAKKQNIPILIWEKFQANYLQKDKFVIAIAGAYGKSTTAAMISRILEDAGFDPTCQIGATVLDWKVNYRMGKSKYYICEVDEYCDKFLYYHPNIAVVLNLGWDHPDFFKTRQAVLDSYKKFVNQIKKGGTLIITDSTLQKLLVERNHIYETNHSSREVALRGIKVIKVEDFGKLNLSIVGDFRKENTDAALTVAKILQIDLKKAAGSVEKFKGTGRRLEFKGKISDVAIYDDYAVQPYTVLTTANALKEKFASLRVVLVFEPHTFSRIKTFFKEFVESLSNTKVDRVLITNIYAAREHGNTAKLSRELAKLVGSKAKYTGSLEETAKYLRKKLNEFDVILSMGAGDVYKLYGLLTRQNPQV